MTVDPKRVMQIVGELVVENEMLREENAALKAAIQRLSALPKVDDNYRDGTPPPHD